jgi:hypothetical protein
MLQRESWLREGAHTSGLLTSWGFGVSRPRWLFRQTPLMILQSDFASTMKSTVVRRNWSSQRVPAGTADSALQHMSTAPYLTARLPTKSVLAVRK